MEASIEPEDTDRLFDDSPEPEQQPDNSFFGLIIYNISVYFQNPWILLALAGLAYYVYQNYLSNIRLPTRSRDDQVTPQDEEKVMPSPSAFSKFGSSILKFFKHAQFFVYTQNNFGILKS